MSMDRDSELTWRLNSAILPRAGIILLTYRQRRPADQPPRLVYRLLWMSRRESPLTESESTTKLPLDLTTWFSISSMENPLPEPTSKDDVRLCWRRQSDPLARRRVFSELGSMTPTNGGLD